MKPNDDQRRSSYYGAKGQPRKYKHYRTGTDAVRCYDDQNVV